MRTVHKIDIIFVIFLMIVSIVTITAALYSLMGQYETAPTELPPAHGPVLGPSSVCQCTSKQLEPMLGPLEEGFDYSRGK